uniref:Uncharacterized protein n=1 Tax=Rhizophora mucronata TaxID=61149 RepID=A0A2P2LN35_RHIMU
MLHDALERYWPTLSCGSPSTCFGGRGSFWAHEVVIICHIFLLLNHLVLSLRTHSGLLFMPCDG